MSSILLDYNFVSASKCYFWQLNRLLLKTYCGHWEQVWRSQTTHRENVPTWLSGPRFHAPQHNFTPKPGNVTHRWAQWQHQMHFRVTLLIMVVEIRFNFQIGVQCAEKAISKITFNIRWNLKQIWCSWYTWVSKGDIKGFENNGV